MSWAGLNEEDVVGEVEDRDGFVGMGRRGGVGGVVVTGVCERNYDGMRFHVSRLDDMDRTELDGMRYDGKAFGENGGDGIGLDGTEICLKMEHYRIR